MRKALFLTTTLLLLLASRAQAGHCQWQTNPTNVVFGNYSAFGGGALGGTSPYRFRCNPNTQGVLVLTTGANATTYFPRYMANGGSRIAYNLYDANNVVFGGGTGGTTSRTEFNGSPQAKDYDGTFYASAPQGVDVPPGTYVDTVEAILYWDNFSKRSSAFFTVTTVVIAECTVTTELVDFGAYDPVAAHRTAPNDNQGKVNVLCTPGTTVTVSLGNGMNFAGGSRRMAGPAGSMLIYQLYRNAGRTLLWSAAPNTVSGTSTSRNIAINNGMVVYGRAPGGQDPIVGKHSDMVLATVNY